MCTSHPLKTKIKIVIIPRDPKLHIVQAEGMILTMTEITLIFIVKKMAQWIVVVVVIKRVNLTKKKSIIILVEACKVILVIVKEISYWLVIQIIVASKQIWGVVAACRILLLEIQ